MKTYDFSNGSKNTYEVTERHQLILNCPVCGEGTDLIIFDGTEYFNYFQRGNYVQVAFPHLNADQRELLITGIHPECSEEVFGEVYEYQKADIIAALGEEED